MSIEVNDNLLNKSNKDFNDKTGIYESGVWRPYNSITEALENPKLDYRNRGLTIYINKAGVLTEYWFRDGIGNADLIEKAAIVEDATSTVKGKLKLTNDLGGTADLPRVVQVETKPTSDNSSAPASTAFVKGVIAESGGGGSSYVLPRATPSILGGIRIGSGLISNSSGITSLQVKTINGLSIIGTGNIDVSGGGGGGGGGSQSLQQTLNIGRIGDSMQITESLQIPTIAPSTINDGNIWIGPGTSAEGGGGGGTYTLPIATSSILGGIKIGSGLTIDPITGIVSASGGGGGITLTTTGSSGASTLVDGVLNIPVYSGGGGGSPTWGSITGTLSSQTDLNSALLSKQPGLVSGSNIKTINGNSILGGGDLTISGGGGGTVTSVAVSVPTGLTVSGSPITTSGTISISLQSGYSIPTTANQTNWGTAYTHSQVTNSNPHATTLQQVLNLGRVGDSMQITDSMQIPTAAPSGGAGTGSIWVGTGTSAGSLTKTKVNSLSDLTFTSLSIGSTEASKYLVVTNSSAISATITSGLALTSIFVRQGGAGKVSFTGSGVTVLVKPSKQARTEGQNAVVEIFYETATRVVITGDLDNI